MLFQEYAQTDVGKFVKSTKQMHKWTFTDADGRHEVCLYESNVSGKVKVTFDADTCLLKKVKDDVKKSGIQTSAPGYELFFVKIGTKWEFRINFEKFVEHKKAEKKAPPTLSGIRKMRDSEEQEEDVGDVLADLSPAPNKESPALSPIGLSQKQRFFTSEITGYKDTEQAAQEQPNQFTFEDIDGEIGVGNGQKSLPEDGLNFKKPVKATAEIDAWGPDNYALNNSAHKGEQKNTKSTEGMRGPESGEEQNGHFQSQQQNGPTLNPFLSSVDEFHVSAAVQVNNQPQKNNVWNNFQRNSFQPVNDHIESRNPFSSQFQKPIEQSVVNSKPEVDFLSTETSPKDQHLDIEAAKSASFAPIGRQSLQPFQQSARTDAKGPIRLNFKKADDQVFFNKKTSTPELGSERTKTFFGGTPNHQQRNINSSKLFLPRPSEFEQTTQKVPVQQSNWFPNFNTKQQPINNQKQPLNQPVSNRQQQTSWLGQPMANIDSGRYSLQPSTDRNIWRQQNAFTTHQQPKDNTFARKTIAQPLDRQSIMESAKRVDDDQFLKY